MWRTSSNLDYLVTREELERTSNLDSLVIYALYSKQGWGKHKRDGTRWFLVPRFLQGVPSSGIFHDLQLGSRWSVPPEI